MIEVIQDQSGDRALAPDPESAVVAARTLCDDRRTGFVVQGQASTVTFIGPDGSRFVVPETSLWSIRV